MLFCHLLFFFFFSKSTFSKISFRNTIRVSNSLYPDQARHFVRPNLGPPRLERLSVDDTYRQIAKTDNDDDDAMMIEPQANIDGLEIKYQKWV